MQASLSDLLQSLRTPHVDSAFIEIGPASGAVLAAPQRAFLHFLISGDAEVECSESGASTKLTTPGDYVLVLTKRGHRLTTPGCLAPQRSDYFRTRHTHDGPPTIRFGSGRACARLLSGTLRLDASHPLTRALPRFIAVTAAARSGVTEAAVRPEFVQGLQGPGSSTMVTALFDLLVLNALRGAGLPMFVGQTSRQADQLRIPLALTLINSNLQRRWSVATLAEEVGLSRSSFAAAFKEQVGQSPMTYIAAQRMELAGQLLRGRSMSVAEVAWRAGYDSASSFSRFFKRHFGATPAAYHDSHATQTAGVHSHLHWAPFLSDEES